MNLGSVPGKKLLLWFVGISIGLLLLLAAAIRLTTFHPPAQQAELIDCPTDAPLLDPGQTLKVMTWNVQYMAGKDYVFWYDVADGSGPDVRPSPAAITRTFAEVARVIGEESPDLILLQEVNDGAKRTDFEDQLARLLTLLPAEYSCHTSAFYWKAAFLPELHILGSVGMKLSTASKYRIDSATRHQLPMVPKDPFTRQFYFRRAVLEARLPVRGGSEFVALNTHLDAFARGSDTMARQIAAVDELLRRLTDERLPWVIGGDFNVLPPGPQYESLPESERVWYDPESDLKLLFDKYQAVPSLANSSGPSTAEWFTHFPNNPEVSGPALTLDYLFVSVGMTIVTSRVRRDDTLAISDHLPVIAELTLPGS
jgi:endonuclease/exonuclease/phosphatase family metal-dependent hydrolase